MVENEKEQLGVLNLSTNDEMSKGMRAEDKLYNSF